MTRLEKYLLSIARDVIDAETTASRYMLIDDLKVRMSDHFSNNTDADLQIIVPFNGGTKYTVAIKDSQRFLCYNATQIKDLIPYLILIKGMKAPFRRGQGKGATILVADKIAKCQTPTLNWDGIILNTKLKLNKLGAAERGVFSKSKSPWKADEIAALKRMLQMEFNRLDGINDDFQIFLTCTSLTYEEVLNIYKIIVICNPQKATISSLQQALLMLQEAQQPK